MKRQFAPILLLSILFLLSSSCNKDFEQINFEPEIAIPLFSTSSTLADLFDEDTDSSSLVIGQDGSMTLVYNGDIVRREASDVFQAIPPFPGIMTDTFLSAPFTLQNNINIISARFTSGNIYVQVNSDVTEDLDFILEFPDVTKNGETLKIIGEVIYSGNLPAVAIFPINDVTGYDITLGGLEVNVRYYATRKSNGERVKLPSVGFLITDIKFSYLEGYFGYEVHQIERDTVTIDIFKNILQGNLEFTDPRVTITVENSFGFPIRSLVSVLRFSNGTESADLESPAIASGLDFNYPSLQEVGLVKHTDFYFDRNNSNIKDVMNLYPILMDYQIDAISNPDQVFDLVGFMTDSSFFAIRVQVELPLNGKASGFEGEKFYEVDFSSLKDVKKAELKLITDNSMPIEILAQATLLDENDQELGQLLEGLNQILKAAPIDANGYSNGVSQQITFIDADQDLLDKLLLTRKIRVDARFSTSNMGLDDVHIRSTDAVGMRMGLRATLDHTLGE